MLLKTVTLLNLVIAISGYNFQKCSRQEALFSLERPIYEFAMAISSRICEDTRGHFAFSPLTTWLQLVALSQGTKGLTRREIWNVTGLTRGRFRTCYRREFKHILHRLSKDLSHELKRSSVMVIDKFSLVKRGFQLKARSLSDIKVLSLNFDDIETCADKVNDLANEVTDGAIDEVLRPEDFNWSLLLMADAVYFKSAWRYPFNTALTEQLEFYSEENALIGHVQMMKNAQMYNYTEIPLLNARVLEIPCENERLSMLIFLSTHQNYSVTDLFHSMKRTNLRGIFNRFQDDGLRSVNLSLPRFEVNVDLELPEILYDMGMNRIFNPDNGDMKGISDYMMQVSVMAQTVKLRVTEEHVSGSVAAMALLDSEDIVTFNANRPFGFMLVDKHTDFILISGMYSEPEVI